MQKAKEAFVFVKKCQETAKYNGNITKKLVKKFRDVTI